jgi:hypothetical protein
VLFAVGALLQPVRSDLDRPVPHTGQAGLEAQLPLGAVADDVEIGGAQHAEVREQAPVGLGGTVPGVLRRRRGRCEQRCDENAEHTGQ